MRVILNVIFNKMTDLQDD